MTTFKEQMVVDLQVFFNLDEFARTVTYHDGAMGAAGIEVPAVVTFGARRQDGRTGDAEYGLIQVKRADVPDPQYRHWFIIDGKTFYIARDGKNPIVAVDELTWEIKITADERATSWRT